MIRFFLRSALVAAAVAASPARAQDFATEDEVRVHDSAGCLASAIYYEARSESDEGQRAVAQVVMNRLRHPSYPKSVCDVVFQGSKRRTGCQFTFTCDGSLARRPEPVAWQRAHAIAAEILAGGGASLVGDATHYHTTAIRPYWAPSLTRIATLGSHIFYAGGPGGRRRAASSGQADVDPGGTDVSIVYAAATDEVAGAAIKIHRGSVPSSSE